MWPFGGADGGGSAVVVAVRDGEGAGQDAEEGA